MHCGMYFVGMYCGVGSLVSGGDGALRVLRRTEGWGL